MTGLIPPVIRQTSTRSLEFQNAWAALLVGALLLLPADTFESASGYRTFALIAPEPVWGLVFLLLGVVQLVAVLSDRVVPRRLAASLLAVLFAVYLTGFLLANPISAAIPFVLPMVVGQAWAFWQVRRIA